MRQVVVNNSNRGYDRGIFGTSTDNQSYSYIEHFLEAVVVDVVVNDEHESYSRDGYNVGSAKVRILKTQQGRDEAVLSWAFPVDSNVTDYPLIGELVLVTTMLNRLYYIKKINISNRVTAGALTDLIKETDPIVTNKAREFEKNRINPLRSLRSEDRLGNYFEDNLAIYKLKSYEGDIIYEGRFGHSIRFGSSQLESSNSNFLASKKSNSPNILLRVGQSPSATSTTNTQYGLTLEDINNDLTSLWMVADQIVPIKLATVGNRAVHGRSVELPARFDGAQLILNSNRIVINSRRDAFYLHTFGGIHNTTLKNYTVDVGGDYKSYVGKTHSVKTDGLFTIESNDKIILGSNSENSETEQMVLGNSLQNLLDELIQIFERPFGITPSGTVTPLPSVVAKLKILRNTYLRGGILSNNIFVSKTSKVN